MATAGPANLPDGWANPELGGTGNPAYSFLYLSRLGAIETFKRACTEPEAAQRGALRRVLDAARGTEFGRRHDLDRVTDLAGYRAAVPVREFAAFEQDLARVAAGADRVLTRHPATSLVKSSGTTGAPKLLPVTRPWARVVARAQSVWVAAMVLEQEEVVRGRALSVVGSAREGLSSGGLVIGSNTGRMYREQSWAVRWRYAVPYEVFEVSDPEVRHYTLLRIALAADVRSWTTANPTTILALCRGFEQWRGDLAGDLADGTLERGPAAALDAGLRRAFRRWLGRRQLPETGGLGQIWNLAAINCWKGGFCPFFIERLPAALGREVTVREVGITASEGYFAVPLHSSWAGGVAVADGHLIELAPEGGGAPIQLHEAEIGTSYRLILSTTAGLYRYDLNDLVRVVGRYRRAPVLAFLRKGRDVLSVTGEKVTVEQVDLAVRRSVGGDPVGYSVGVRLGERPAYVLCVEGGEIDGAAAKFDAALGAVNVEYASKRGTDRLAPAAIVALPSGTYARWRAEALARGGADGQVKDPVLAHGDDLERLVGGWR